MNLWEGPMELFFWNGVFQCRDKFKRTLFSFDLNTREYFKVKKFREEIGPKIIELMNNYAGNATMPIQEGVTDIEEGAIDFVEDMINEAKKDAVLVEAPKSNGNGHSSPPKKRGRPVGWRKPK